MWWRDGGSNFTCPMPGGKQAAFADPLAAFSEPLARAIVDAEVNSSMWTLMHRCNKASDLLNEVLQVRGCFRVVSLLFNARRLLC